MAKRLTMAEIDTILTLHKAGHSNREIAALVGVNRETVGKHLARIKAQNQPNAPTGKRPRRRLQNPSDSTLATPQYEEIISRNPTIHWLVSTRPGLAGSNAPRDTPCSNLECDDSEGIQDVSLAEPADPS